MATKYEKALALYEKLLAGMPDSPMKGAANKYTSRNGARNRR